MTEPYPFHETGGTSDPVPGPRRSLPRVLTAALPYVAPALLVVIAVQQIILASTAHLSPWTGGGFGMFSSIDNIRSRIVRAVLVVDGRDIPIRLESNDAFTAALFKAGILPTQARLTALAESLARRTWLLDRSSQFATLAGDGSPSAAARTIPSPTVRLDVYRIHFHPDTLELERVFLADAMAVAP